MNYLPCKMNSPINRDVITFIVLFCGMGEVVGLDITGKLFTTTDGKRHDGSPTDSFIVHNARECSQHCNQDTKCFSFNVLQLSSSIECQINNASQQIQLVEDPAATFYSKLFMTHQ